MKQVELHTIRAMRKVIKQSITSGKKLPDYGRVKEALKFLEYMLECLEDYSNIKEEIK